MDETIRRAMNSLTQTLESLSDSDEDRHDMAEVFDIRNILNQLFESHSPTNEWTHLFCRRLNRLMDYNESRSYGFWIELHDDILYVLEGLNGRQGLGKTWNRFLKRMRLEEKLKQREFQFQQIFGRRKSFDQLFCEHQKFFEKYLQKCISLHSKVQVRGLVENLEDFLYNSCGLTEASFTQKNQKYLKEKLECIEIPLDCSTRSLQNISDDLFKQNDSYGRVNNSLSHFLPSAEQRFYVDSIRTETVEKVLKSERWIVILGDPGSAKTTLLRWITHIFAEAAFRGDEEVVLKGVDRSAVRIPILIRTGEFAAWLNQHQNMTLIDYIGTHTWFSQHYSNNDDGCVLRELIYHGHALILLDGLDEISEFERRGDIVDLVTKFMDEYVRAPDFLSPLDDPMYVDRILYVCPEAIELQPPSESGGNHIIITSRIVGYQLYPLVGPLIRHYSLVLMNDKQAQKFVNEWMVQVENGVHEILVNEGITIDGETMKTLSKRRKNVMQSIFEKSPKFLTSNPSLLSLLATFIFHSPNDFHPKSRVEVYNHAVQSALRSWTTQEPTISEDLLTHFLINLSTYLHLESPSGLIDTFDMKHLCCLILQQQGLSNDRAKLREYAKKLITILESNIGIVAELGPQVFGFLHLSFQEYFVSQSFIRNSSVEEVAERILMLTINPRFRESLFHTLDWISWKWSSDDYDKFCNLLIIPNKNYAIPLGTLLLFDAFKNLRAFPLKSIIFTALDSLLYHPFNMIAQSNLIWSLSQLPENIIIEWMHSRLKNDQRLSKFCQCLLWVFDQNRKTREIVLKSVSPVLYQQLWLFYNINTSVELVIDQTLRRIMMSKYAPDDIFSNKLSSCFSSQNIRITNIHPLILSVINAVCGGISFKTEKDMIKIDFSPKRLHRDSSIILPIIEYLENNKESHSIKVQTLIKQYKNVLKKVTPSDTSLDIVDTFIALICLKGLSQPLIYQNFVQYRALPMALNRLKQTWFYLKNSYNHIPDYIQNKSESKITFEVESIINKFCGSQSTQSDEERLALSFAFTAALYKLDIRYSPRLLVSNLFLTNNVSRYLECQPEFNYFDNQRKLDQIVANIHPMQMFKHEPYFLLTFVPQSLQNLYHCMIIAPTNNTDSLPFVVLLSQCLILLEDVDKNDPNFYLALLMLQPYFKEYMLENYASVPFCKDDSKFVDQYEKWKQEELLGKVKRHLLLDQIFFDEPKDWKMLINVERQRICDAKNALQYQEKDWRLFASSISLARLFQGQHQFDEYQRKKSINLSPAESEEVHFAVINIRDPILRIIAWSIILDMKDPLIFNEEQRDKLRWEMIILLKYLLLRLPLLTATLLYVRCYTVRKVFSVPFHHMARVIGKKLNETPIDRESQDQVAAFIALQQLNNSDLSDYLSEFTKQTKNLSDLLQFNSSIFYRYFTKTTSFNKSDTTLLSLMYLTEVAFDAQILQMYTGDDHKSKISLLKDLKQLWNDSSKSGKIMTYRVATWITNYLELLNKAEIEEIIEDLSECVMIERKALSMIEKWLTYRMNKDLRFFAQYAALQLIIEGSDICDLTDIIIKMFDIDSEFRLKVITARLFNSRIVDLTTLRKILISLHRNVFYSSKISGWIDRKEIFELILNLEFERVISNIHQSSGISNNPFLLMIDDCSHDLQLHLVDHLRTFTNDKSEVENTIKEEYIAVVVKWIIESSIWNRQKAQFSQELYKYIFTILHDQQFPQVQKAVVNGLNSVFIHKDIREEDVFYQDDAIEHLEKVIHSYDTYSNDVLSFCLLAYGNCLRKLQEYEISRNVPNEIQHSLTTLLDTSLSEVISIRADFCLILAQQSTLTFTAISDWFTNKWNLTPEKKYKILLQRSLYQRKNNSFDEDLHEIVDHLRTHSGELLDTFVIELYNYLLNRCDSNYLSDPTPDYVTIAFMSRNAISNVFRNAIKKSSFGEEKFKRELYLYHTKKPRDSQVIVNLYASFSVLTVELIEMLKYYDDDPYEDVPYDTIRYCLECINQVSNPEVIQKLFKELDSILYDNKFEYLSFLLMLLVQLTKANLVSLVEVHKRVSLIINHLSYYINNIDRYNKYRIVHFLFELSCNRSITNDRANLFSENDIDEEFEKRTEYIENKSSLFLRRNYFLTVFRSLSLTSN